MKIHHTRGVYSDGSFKDNGVADTSLKEHVEYNLKMRPGRALFVDGKCVNQGYLTREQCDRIERQLKKNPIHMKKDTAPYQ
jgi:hypothetical protein